MKFRTKLSSLLLLTACSAAVEPAPQTATTAAPATPLICSGYTVTDLGLVSSAFASTGLALDADARVTGITQRPGSTLAFTWTESDGTTELGTLGGTYSFGYGISGDRVVGESETASGGVHAYVADSAGLHDLGTLGGTGIYDRSDARGVNSSGVVVGSSRLPTGFQRAVRFENGTVTDLGTLAGTLTSNSRALAVNENGLIVGVSGRTSGPEHAAAWDGTQVIDLGAVFAGGASIAYAVNASGVAAGQAHTSPSFFHPVVFKNGAVIDLGVPAGFERGTALGINDAGHVVGNITHTSEVVVRHGFIYDGTTLVDLNSVGIVGWEITAANAINNAGQIIGVGVDTDTGLGVDKRPRAVLLTPICHEPETPFLRSIATSTGSSTVSSPAEVAEGDLLIATFEYCADPVDFTPPPGWTLVADQLSGAGTEQVFHALVYQRTATADEPGEYVFAAPPEVYVSSQVAAYANVSEVASVASTSAFSDEITAPGLVTTQPDEMFVVFYADFTFGDWSVAPGMTEQSDFDSNSLQDELRPTPGATGGRTATNSFGAMSAVSLTLR